MASEVSATYSERPACLGGGKGDWYLFANILASHYSVVIFSPQMPSALFSTASRSVLFPPLSSFPTRSALSLTVVIL